MQELKFKTMTTCTSIVQLNRWHLFSLLVDFFFWFLCLELTWTFLSTMVKGKKGKHDRPKSGKESFAICRNH